MKAFRFPLRSVATLRANAEFRAREGYAAAIRTAAAAAERQAAWRRRLANLEAALAAARGTRFAAAGAAAQFRAYRAECGEAAGADQALAAARGELHQRREVYLEAHRQVQLMTRVEDRARAAHRAEQARIEQAELDDLAGRRRSRSRLHP